MIPKIMWLVEQRCAIIFLKVQTYDLHLTDNKTAENPLGLH